MVFCMVKSCKERTGKMRIKSGEHVTFHIFPADVKRKEQWAEAIGVQVEKVNKHSRVCSKHFDEEMFDRTSLSCVRLRKHAVPHLKENITESIQIMDCYSINDRFIHLNDWENNLSAIFDINEADISYEPCDSKEENVSYIDNENPEEFGILKFDLDLEEANYSNVNNVNKIKDELDAMDFESFSNQENYICHESETKEASLETINYESLLKNENNNSNISDDSSIESSMKKEMESLFSNDIKAFMSPRICNSPFKKLLLDQLNCQQRKHTQEIKVLMQTHKRLKKRISKLMTIIQTLQNKKKKKTKPT